MIPIDIGPITGAAFGASDELERIEAIGNASFRAYQRYYQRNPRIYHNDYIFTRLINIIREYDHKRLSIKKMIPNIAQHLELVYRNQLQKLHDTDLGKLLLIPTFDDSISLFTVLYSDATDLNYNPKVIIGTTTFVTINIKLLTDLIRYYDKSELGTNSLITNEIFIPLSKGINDYAIFNTITGIKDIELGAAPEHPFYLNNLNKYVYTRRGHIAKNISNLDTNPLDVLESMPISTKLKFNTIEDSYIDNLLWINLLSYRNIVTNSGKINRPNLYKKFFRAYSLYSPRGRGDKYFTNASSELLDKLEEIEFI